MQGQDNCLAWDAKLTCLGWCGRRTFCLPSNEFICREVLCGQGDQRQFFSFIQMMLDGRKCLLSELLYVCIVAARRVFFEEVQCLLMGVDLLLGVGFIEVISGGTIEIVDTFWCLASNLVGGSTLIFLVPDAR